MITVAPCKGGGAVPRQQWEFDSAARLRAVGTQSCADVSGQSVALARDDAASAVPVMAPCSNVASQQVRTPPAAPRLGESKKSASETSAAGEHATWHALYTLLWLKR